MSSLLKVSHDFPSKVKGTSPSEDRYYVLVLFDISDQKKYRVLVKILKSYGNRVQKSIFEAQIKKTQIRALKASVERLMSSERFYNPDDNIRVYEISGYCEMTVFGERNSTLIEENIFV